MLLIKPSMPNMPATIPDSPASSPRLLKDDDDFIMEDSPLDLRIKCGRISPGARDSGTESDDLEEKILQDGGPDCKPYKKSLIKRCKCWTKKLNLATSFLKFIFFLRFIKVENINSLEQVLIF